MTQRGAMAHVIFVILSTPAPFSADTKNALIPDFLTQKNTKFKIFTPHQAENLTLALPVVPGTNIRYVQWRGKV